ncbi:MAG: hypothetical protein E6Q59_07450 [Nitrosomonas sp.]|nr:MAG: hypothetical protein E6Q59_07450 [Nitrosomonas sp.]
MRRYLTVLLFLLIVIGGSLGIVFREQIANYLTRERYSPEREQRDLKTAEELLNHHQPKEALAIIDKYQERYEQKGDAPKKWVDLYIKGAVATQSPERILFLYQQYPKALLNNEDAALIVGDVLIKTARTNDYKELRGKWQGRESKPEVWFVLDADKQLIDGDRNAAITFLNTHSFEGAKDIPRLVRLALLNVEINPRMSWEYLAEAYQKDPNNPEVRSYRARLLEAVGKTALSLTEYISAAQLAPDNIVMRDQLAEFYRRHGRYKLALKVWESSLGEPLSDFVWIKTWFWSRVAVPVDFKWSDKKAPEGELKPLIDYLLSLESDQYWDASKYESVRDGNRYLQSEQATFWLRLLQALKDNKEDKAWELLEYNHFNSASWNPKLEIMLKRILNYRKNGTIILSDNQLNASTSDNTSQQKHPSIVSKATNEESDSRIAADKAQQADSNGQVVEQPHPFFTELQEIATKAKGNPAAATLPPDVQKLLSGKDAFSAALLASGWLEAAIQFNGSKVIPEGYPDWMAYGLAQAYRYNQGSLPALEFATKQIPTPTLNLLIGELLIANGSPDAGLEKLLPLVDLKNDIGFRASWLAALLYAQREQYDKATAMIQGNPRLAADVLGKEALARIALLQGKNDEADKLYSALEADSWEAKSYLARKAFNERNWKRAKQLTETLLREFPNNMLLRENYERILEEESKATGQPRQPVGSTPGKEEQKKQPPKTTQTDKP